MKKSWKLLLTLLITIMILVSLQKIGFLRPLENLFFSITSPIQRISYSLSLSINTWSKNTFVSKQEIINENDNLKKELEALTIDRAQIELLKKEKNELQAALKTQSTIEKELISARVIGKGSDAIKNTFIINKGLRDGIYNGAPVLYGNNIMIGQIIDVFENYAHVLLITDNSSEIAASILNKDYTVGLIAGNHNINMIFTLIPKDEVVLIDTPIITSGGQELIQRGFVIGTVSEVINNPNDLFNTAIVKQPVNYNKIHTVYIPEKEL